MGDKLSEFRGKEGIICYIHVVIFSENILISEGINCYFLL